MSKIKLPLWNEFSVSCGNDPRILKHQDNRPLRRPRPVNDSFRDNETLARSEFDQTIFQINEQLTFDHVEEFVIVVLLMPVILAFDTSNSSS